MSGEGVKKDKSSEVEKLNLLSSPGGRQIFSGSCYGHTCASAREDMSVAPAMVTPAQVREDMHVAGAKAS